MNKIINYFKKNKILSALVIILTVTTFSQAAYLKHLRKNISNMETAKYQKAFFDLSSALSNIDTSLNKALITNDSSHLNIISGEILKEAMYAKACLGDLPRKDVNLTNSQKFLSHVSDYVTTLSLKSSQNGMLSYDEKENLKNLSLYADKLSSSVAELENQFLTGELHFNNIVMASAEDEEANGYFKNIEAQFENYPTLIYDGPFSDHISTLNAKMLEGEPEISEETAKKKALSFLDFLDIKELKKTSDAEGKIAIYGFTAKLYKDRDIYIDVTKKGGHIISYIDSRQVNEDNISFDQATLKAKAFLESKGFLSFEKSFYEKTNNIITINFFPAERDIIFYPDLIKIKIAADDGSVIGFECKNYLENHFSREIVAPAVSEEEARKSLSDQVTITDSRLCVIPLYSGKEVLCYEFKGSFNKKDYLCYVNAQTGHGEKIFLILKDDNRILTV